jgi:hypothetical protein
MHSSLTLKGKIAQRERRREEESGGKHNINCGKAEDIEAKLKACLACRLVKYCSRDCRIAHRPQHKKPCRKRTAELYDEELFSLQKKMIAQYVSCNNQAMKWVKHTWYAVVRRSAAAAATRMICKAMRVVLLVLFVKPITFFRRVHENNGRTGGFQ